MSNRVTIYSGIYKCEHCGNNRFFYSEVSVAAKKRIDLKNGSRNDKIYDIDKNIEDGDFEVIYCGKCEELVDDDVWSKNITWTQQMK